MLDLKRHVFCPAVSTPTAPFFEQVFANFVATKRALLRLDSADLRVLHLLQVELDEFLGERRDGCKLAEPPNPGDDVSHSALH